MGFPGLKFGAYAAEYCLEALFFIPKLWFESDFLFFKHVWHHLSLCFVLSGGVNCNPYAKVHF